MTQPTTHTAAASATNAVKVYGSGETAVTALAGVTVAFERACFSAIMGPSGSGKSTLLHCMAGLDAVSSGRLTIGDIDVTALSEKERTRLRRDKIGFVFQSFNLVPTLTAEENILLPLALARRPPDRSWIDSLIATIGIGDRLNHYPHELSGGQQQRVAVARALAGRPEIVFADEPTGNLDTRRGTELLELMRSLVREHGQTIVMVTHDPAAAAYTDRVVFLKDGHIVDELAAPSVEALLDRLKSLET